MHETIAILKSLRQDLGMKKTKTLSLLTAICAIGLFFIAASPSLSVAQALRQTKGEFTDLFRQLDPEELPTPNDYRAASGAPGHRYWQQQVDYDMHVRLDEDQKRVIGRARITYHNNSPDQLTYLWFLLDQDNFRRDSIAELTRTTSETGRISYEEAQRIRYMRGFAGGFTINKVALADGTALAHDTVDTLMRVDLATPLESGQTVTFDVEWSVPFVNTNVAGGRSGYECFNATGQDGNCIFLAAQFFPRLAAYSDFEGWHNKAFLGSGEFTLEFGNYKVEIDAPADFVVAATGELANPEAVLTNVQRQRLAAAKRNYDRPTYIVSPAEAAAAEMSPPRNLANAPRKLWQFTATNVRDFAFAGSRKFIWDAMAVSQQGAPDVLAQSFFPKEGDPLWSAYSTQAIAHTIKVYGHMAFPYPYPVAQSVNGPVGGMEYPMITFNGPRPVVDDNGNITYSERTKYGLISVVIHEIGHNWFPMVVNSDERQWSWMDEGLNTFVQYIAEQEWSTGYPSRRGDPADIAEYMLSTNQMPIMTQSDSIAQFGANAYGKPATALVILRETIMGRARFDRAFKEYSTRWRFHRPTPSDFFRTMEESSGVDLDWFWRGWFYTTDHVDIAINSVREATINSGDPTIEAARLMGERAQVPVELTEERNRGVSTVLDRHPELRDYYDRTDRLSPSQTARTDAATANERLSDEEEATRNMTDKFYVVALQNLGGLPMPVILQFNFVDGPPEIVRIPAEIWRRDPHTVNWTYVTNKTVVSVELDPRRETSDANRNNNYFPQRIEPTRLDVYRARTEPNNQMDGDHLVVSRAGLQTSPAPDAPAATNRPARPNRH